MILAQAMAEYGLLTSLIAGLSAASHRLEVYIGAGNTGYFFLGLTIIILLLLARRRRFRRW